MTSVTNENDQPKVAQAIVVRPPTENVVVVKVPTLITKPANVIKRFLIKKTPDTNENSPLKISAPKEFDAKRISTGRKIFFFVAFHFALQYVVIFFDIQFPFCLVFKTESWHFFFFFSAIEAKASPNEKPTSPKIEVTKQQDLEVRSSPIRKDTIAGMFYFFNDQSINQSKNKPINETNKRKNASTQFSTVFQFFFCFLKSFGFLDR